VVEINDEDRRLLTDTDQLCARLDLLIARYAQVQMEQYKADWVVDANVDSLRKNTIRALAGVDTILISNVSLKAAVADLIAQSNRVLLGILERQNDSGASAEPSGRS
jgi:hypothetical protein